MSGLTHAAALGALRKADLSLQEALTMSASCRSDCSDGRWDGRLRRVTLEFSHEITYVRVQGIGDLEDLDEVEPSLTALVLRHE